LRIQRPAKARAESLDGVFVEAVDQDPIQLAMRILIPMRVLSRWIRK
jgi:hypothetical protein